MKKKLENGDYADMPDTNGDAGEWIEMPFLSSDENSLKVSLIGIGEMRIMYVHNGEEILFPNYYINVEPMDIVRFPEGEYYAGMK